MSESAKLYIKTDYASGRPEIIPFGSPRGRPLREMSMVLTTEALAEIVRQGQEWLDAERQIAIRDIWLDGPDSEARRAARGETLPERMRRDAEQRGTLPPGFVGCCGECCGDVDEMTPAERIRYYEDCIRGARADLCAVAPDHNAEDEPCLHPEPDPTHTPAVRRVVAWRCGTLRPSMKKETAYVRAARRLIGRAFYRGGRVYFRDWDGFMAKHWPVKRIKKVAAYLRHRDEKAGYR